MDLLNNRTHLSFFIVYLQFSSTQGRIYIRSYDECYSIHTMFPTSDLQQPTSIKIEWLLLRYLYSLFLDRI